MVKVSTGPRVAGCRECLLRPGSDVWLCDDGVLRDMDAAGWGGVRDVEPSEVLLDCTDSSDDDGAGAAVWSLEAVKASTRVLRRKTSRAL